MIHNNYKDDDNRKKIALLIDCDNISFKSVEKILEELEPFGDIIIKRAYGNWHNEGLKNWMTKLMELSIKPIQQIDYTKGKNATDMAIAIDAMKLLYEKKLDAFAIVSSDSDFTPLVMTLQEEGKKVYGFGYESSPQVLQRACSIFTNLTPSLKESKAADANKEKDKDKTKTKEGPFNLKQKVIDVFVSLSPENEQVSFEKLNQVLKENGVDYSRHGFKQFKVFLDSLNIFNMIINKNHQGFAFLKQVRSDCSPIDINSDATLLKQVMETFDALSHDNKPVLSSTLYNLLGLKFHFKFKNYGFSSFKSFLENYKALKLVFLDGQWYVTKA